MVQVNGLRLMPIANIAELIDLKWIAGICFNSFHLHELQLDVLSKLKGERTHFTSNPKLFPFKSEIAMSQI